MNDGNPLLNLIVSTAVGPAHVMTNYLDEASKSSFFKTSRGCYQFHQKEYPSVINEFLNNLEGELTTFNKPLFLKYSIFPRIKHASIIAFIGFLALYGGGTLISNLIITHEHNEIKFQIYDTHYSSNQSSHCDDLVNQNNQNYFIDTILENCNDLFKTISDKYTNWKNNLPFLFSFLTWQVIIFSSINSFINLAKLIEYINTTMLPLTFFSPTLQHGAEQLFTKLRKRGNGTDISLTTESSTREIYHEFKAINKHCQASGQAFRFFKTPLQHSRYSATPLSDDEGKTLFYSQAR